MHCCKVTPVNNSLKSIGFDFLLLLLKFGDLYISFICGSHVTVVALYLSLSSFSLYYV